MLVFQLFVVLLAAFSVSSQENCNICPDHTLCEYTGISDKCTANPVRGVEDPDKDNIVKYHNERRNKVAGGEETRGLNGQGQPSATNMLKMTWNDEIATIAQRWADQCNFGHDTCRNTGTFSWVGQNVFMSSLGSCDQVTDSPDWEGATEGWYSEVDKFDRGGVSHFQFDENTGHYTQLVWAKSNNVGCGYTAWSDGETCFKYYVCNYGPGGNFGNEPIYEEGDPRASCTESPADGEYPALC